MLNSANEAIITLIADPLPINFSHFPFSTRRAISSPKWRAPDHSAGRPWPLRGDPKQSGRPVGAVKLLHAQKQGETALAFVTI
jgi:hypothetical protein